MNVILKLSMLLIAVAVLGSACVPKKFDIALPNNLKLDLNANTDSKFNFSLEDLLHGKVNKTIESLADYTAKEISALVMKSEPVVAAAKLLEATEKVECYSDGKDYLKMIKMNEEHYSFHLSLICFNPTNLPNTGAMSEQEKLSISVSAAHAFFDGDITWSKDGLVVSTKNGEHPDVSIKPTHLLVLEFARNYLIRVAKP